MNTLGLLRTQWGVWTQTHCTHHTVHTTSRWNQQSSPSVRRGPDSRHWDGLEDCVTQGPAMVSEDVRSRAVSGDTVSGDTGGPREKTRWSCVLQTRGDGWTVADTCRQTHVYIDTNTHTALGQMNSAVVQGRCRGGLGVSHSQGLLQLLPPLLDLEREHGDQEQLVQTGSPPLMFYKGWLKQRRHFCDI